MLHIIYMISAFFGGFSLMHGIVGLFDHIDPKKFEKNQELIRKTRIGKMNSRKRKDLLDYIDKAQVQAYTALRVIKESDESSEWKEKASQQVIEEFLDSTSKTIMESGIKIEEDDIYNETDREFADIVNNIEW